MEFVEYMEYYKPLEKKADKGNQPEIKNFMKISI